jgi:hypothetical protein
MIKSYYYYYYYYYYTLLFTHTLTQPIIKANYKVSTTKRHTKQSSTHKGKTKQGNVCHLDNNHSSSAIMLIMM